MDRRRLRQRAALVGALVSLALVLAIVLGSRGLRDFDSALLPYAVATVFLAFGVAYRYTMWVSEPAAWRMFRQGLRALVSAESFRRAGHDPSIRQAASLR